MISLGVVDLVLTEIFWGKNIFLQMFHYCLIALYASAVL